MTKAHPGVLILTNIFRPNVGGAETHLEDLIKEGSNYYFYVVTYQPLVTKAIGEYLERGANFEIYRIPWIRFNLFLTLVRYPMLEFFYLFPGLFIFGFFLLAIKGRRIKTIHAHGLVAGTAAMILGYLFRMRVIVSTHSIYNFRHYSLYQRFVQYVLNRVDFVLTLSTQSRNEIIRIGVNPGRIGLFVNWIDQTKFFPQSKNQARAKLNLPQDKFICLFVGRLVAEKGVKELLGAIDLIKKNERVLFVVIGDGPLSTEVSRFERSLPNLEFRGRIDNHDLPAYYNAADVFIIPSTHEEGFGRVILEALSCGTPVIGSARGAIPEIITDQLGLLINVTPGNIKTAVEELSLSKAHLDRMSKKASSVARRLYSSKNISMITKYYV